MTAEDAQAQAETIRQMTAAVLKKDVDFGVIPGTKKPSLLKPGAEWLLKWYGLGHEFEMLDTEIGEDLKKFGVTYRCRVTKAMPNGTAVTVATCDGYASRDEKQWAKAPWNTIIKMAQKRAMVGAALQATGSSGLFTQDMEDTVTQSRFLDLTPLIETLTEDEKARARSMWMARKYPAPSRMDGVQALEAAFELGVIRASSDVVDVVVVDMEVREHGESVESVLPGSD